MKKVFFYISLIVISTTTQAMFPKAQTLENDTHLLRAPMDVVSLFPEKLTFEQICEFYSHKPVRTFAGDLHVDQDGCFYEAQPGSWQFISQWYAPESISFNKTVGIDRHPITDKLSLYGTYRWKSLYAKSNDTRFRIWLSHDALQIFNLTDSILEKDFSQHEGQPVSNLSPFYLASTDKKFIETTNHLPRLNENIKTLLTARAQLDESMLFHKDFKDLDENELSEIGNKAFKELQKKLERQKIYPDPDGAYKKEVYAKLIPEIQEELLNLKRLSLGDIPTIDELNQHDLMIQAMTHKVYFMGPGYAPQGSPRDR